MSWLLSIFSHRELQDREDEDDDDQLPSAPPRWPMELQPPSYSRRRFVLYHTPPPQAYSLPNPSTPPPPLPPPQVQVSRNPVAYSPPSLTNLSTPKPRQVLLSTTHVPASPPRPPPVAKSTTRRPRSRASKPALPLKVWRPKLLDTAAVKGGEEVSALNRPPPVALAKPSESTNVPSKASSPLMGPATEGAESTHPPLPPPLALADNGDLPTESLKQYELPQHLKQMIERDTVPPVLFRPLTPLTYADYFACLLYAEDYYIEKWSDLVLYEVTLELLNGASFEKAREIMKTEKKHQIMKKDFVVFEITAVTETLPFLLSSDFVFVRPSGEKTDIFKGILFCVVKGVVLVEFQDDFHEQHSSSKKYDVSFSFNRVCLKRAHHAVSAANDPSFHNIIFPDASPCLQILNQQDHQPYLIEGPLSTTSLDQLSSTGYTVRDTVLQIYLNVPHCRILICAPSNRTCDLLTRCLQKDISQTKLFAVNAAFGDYKLVPGQLLPACLYEKCITCPPLSELKEFKVITSTFMSSFRLSDAGIDADHFTHIFLVDASLATEPEVIVSLLDFVTEKTIIVVCGCSKKFPHFVRSDIARRHGLRKSYFHRLLEREPYSTRDPKFITHLQE